MATPSGYQVIRGGQGYSVLPKGLKPTDIIIKPVYYGGGSSAGTPISQKEISTAEQIEKQARQETFKATQQYQRDLQTKSLQEASQKYSQSLADIKGKYTEQRLKSGIISGYLQKEKVPVALGSSVYRIEERRITKEDLLKETPSIISLPELERTPPIIPTSGKTPPFWEIKTPQERLAEAKWFQKIAPYIESYGKRVSQPIFTSVGGGDMPPPAYRVIPTIPKRETIGGPEFVVSPYQEPPLSVVTPYSSVKFALVDVPAGIGKVTGIIAEKGITRLGIGEKGVFISKPIIPPSGMTTGGIWAGTGISDKFLTYKETAKTTGEFLGTSLPYAFIPSPVLLGGGAILIAKGTTEEKLTGGILAGFGALGIAGKLKAPRITYRYPKVEPRFDEIQFPVKIGEKETIAGYFKITQKVPPVEARVSNLMRDILEMKPLLEWTPITKPKTYVTTSPFGFIGEEPYISLAKKVKAKAGTISEVSGKFGEAITKETKLSDFDRWLLQRGMERRRGLMPEEYLLKNLNQDIVSFGNIYAEKMLKITPSKMKVEPISFGRRISEARAVSFLKKMPVKKEIPYDVFQAQLTFKETTKPFFRMAGKTPSMTGRILAYKRIPEEEVQKKFLSFIGGKKSSVKFIQKLYQPQILIKEIPKFPKIKLPKTETFQETFLAPAMVGGGFLVQSIKERQIQKPAEAERFAFAQKQTQKFVEAFALKPSERFVEAFALKPAQIEKQIQKPTPTERFAFALIPVQVQKFKQIPKVPVPFTPRIPKPPKVPSTPRIPKPPISIPILSGRKFRKAGQISGYEFIPELRRRGKFMPISKPTTLKKAVEIGKQAARRTLGASIRVKGPKGYIGLLPSEEFIFGKKGKEPTILMQKKFARLKTPTELKEIIWARKK